MGAYETGAALSAQGYDASARYSQNFLTPRQTNALAGKITADLPGSRTRVSASYEWLPSEFVTMVDPAGQGNLQLQPYLGVEIRQPIPTPNFLPVHIDAVADFQNLLSQGYAAGPRGGDKPVVLELRLSLRQWRVLGTVLIIRPGSSCNINSAHSCFLVNV